MGKHTFREKYYMYHITHVKVAPVGLGAKAALVIFQEILPVRGIVEGEEADVLLLLRRHDGGSGIALNGRGRDGDGRIGLGLSSRRRAERSLPSRRLGRRGADGGRRKEQVDDCGVVTRGYQLAQWSVKSKLN